MHLIKTLTCHMLLLAKKFLRRLLPRRVYAWLRTRRAERQLHTFNARWETHQFGGSSLEVLICDPGGEAWYSEDKPLIPEISFLRKLGMGVGDIVFDLGAHQAVIAMVIGDIVGNTGKIVAIEANRHNAKVAEKNCKRNGMNHVHVLHAAVSDKVGTVKFEGGFGSRVDEMTGEWLSEEVDAVSIDLLAKQYGEPNVVFIDVEGFECRALSGAIDTLRRCDLWFVEVHVGEGLERFGGSAAAVLEAFPVAEFDVHVAGLDEEYVRLEGLPPKQRFFLIAQRRRPHNLADLEQVS